MLIEETCNQCGDKGLTLAARNYAPINLVEAR